MWYTFNTKTNKCVARNESEPQTIEDGTFVKKLEYNPQDITYMWWDPTVDNIKFIFETETLETKARDTRNSIRNDIDSFLLPASTYKNDLVTQEQKDMLINDSLLLARWPSTKNWPNIALPTLSDFANEVLDIPQWPPIN